MAETIYLDYQASTPVAPQVREAMLPWFGASFGNPHSAHPYGEAAAQAVTDARHHVAQALHADEKEIIFTSGATEANNMAILGAARHAQQQELSRRHIVTVATEHRSVLEACDLLRQEGHPLTILPVRADGLVEVEAVQAALRDDSLLLSVMAVNNETGVIQPLAGLGALCRARGIYFHTDAAQAFGKIPLDVEAMQLDMLSLSGHKAYAPQGIGALYLRRKPRMRIAPLLHGGGQERGLRAGTVPVALAAGLGAAAQLAQPQNLHREQQRLLHLRGVLLESLEQSGCHFRIAGSLEQRVAGNLNLLFDGLPAGAWRGVLPHLAVSSGSACSSASDAPSHVLQAMGEAANGLRISFGRFTTEADIRRAAQILAAVVADAEQGKTPLFSPASN